MANSQAHAYTEVPAQKDGGLPQLDFATFEEQLVWLFLSFILLFVIVSRFALPSISKVLVEREERIADDLDRAERLKREAEEVRTNYEEASAASRKNAHDLVLGAKDDIQADIAAATKKLDSELGAKAEEAEALIAKAKADALAGIDTIATDVAADVIAKLGGESADENAVKAAVESALVSVKGTS